MATFYKVSQVFQKIEETDSRNEITEILVDAYSKFDGKEVQIFSYLLLGRVAPMFVSSEFNLSEKSLIKVLQNLVEFKNVQFDVVKEREDSGDIGLTAEQVLEKIDTSAKATSITDMYQKLWELVNITGTGSTDRKAALLTEILSVSRPLEAKYLCRIITGKLRLGASDRTVLDAFSFILAGDKSERDLIEQYYGVNPDLGVLAYIIKGLAEDNKKIFSVETDPTPGIPIQSRLVERVKNFDEVFERLGDGFYVQPKYDGIRCQVHKGVDYDEDQYKKTVWIDRLDNNEEGSLDMFSSSQEKPSIKLFSRNLEDITDMFPEITDALEQVPMKNFIIDCEVVGWDEENDCFMPFQDTMTRKRKYDIQNASNKVPVRLFMFDVISLEGKSLINVDLEKRVEFMQDLFAKNFKTPLFVAETYRIKDMDKLNQKFDEAVDEGLEGLIVKQFNGGYQAGKRNFEWLKLKKSMNKGLVDTVDVVIMGYYYGSGKKTKFGMGALLGGVIDKKGDIRTITKIGTGITDDQWNIISKRLKEIETKQKPKEYFVEERIKPDVWVIPEVVCSVEADEITRSKVHTAGLEIGEIGYALRFPRLLEFDRDKDAADATSEKEFIQMIS